MALLSLSSKWIVNPIEKTEIVRRLFVAGRLTNLAPDEIVSGIKADSQQIVSKIQGTNELLSKNITVADEKAMTIPKLVALLEARGESSARLQQIRDLELPSIYFNPQANPQGLQGMDQIIGQWNKRSTRSNFHRDVPKMPKSYFKTWQIVQAEKDTIDYLIIRHYEIFGIKLSGSTNPRLFKTSTPPPIYGEEKISPPPLTKEVVSALRTPTPDPEPTPEPTPEPVVETPDRKWILLGVMGVGLLIAIIFILRGRK